MHPRWQSAPAALLVALFLAAGCSAQAGEPHQQTDHSPASAAVATTDIPRGGGVTARATQTAPSEPVLPATPATARAAPPAPSTPTPIPTSVPPPAAGPEPRRVRDTVPPPVQAKAAVVIDADSGAVLYDKDAHTPLPPASTSKILTLLLALERGNPDEVIEVQLDNRTYWGSTMGLVTGDRFTLRDLMYGLMLPSGNDAAHVIARHIAGSEAAFADLMNEWMRSLGLRESLFRNASGLGRTETGNMVSAFDLAQLSRVAMANPEFVKIVTARSWVARGSRTIVMNNGNELLYRYPGADGVKIGWGGNSAGQTIAGSAIRNGHRLIVVLLNTPDRPGEAAALLNWAFGAFSWVDD